MVKRRRGSGMDGQKCQQSNATRAPSVFAELAMIEESRVAMEGLTRYGRCCVTAPLNTRP